MMFHINRYVKKDISNSNFFKKGLQGLQDGYDIKHDSTKNM